MYGKFFASTFSGSLFGAGSDVFAVWGYVIANAIEGQVELNPRLLASVIGTDHEAVERSIEFLCSPDPSSRSPEEDGRRLIREGQFAYRVTNHRHYRSILNEAERRDYNRQKKRESRLRSKTESMTVIEKSAVSAHTEAKTEAEAEKEQQTIPQPPASVALVFDHWKAVMAHPTAKLVPKRKRLIEARLREGYSVDDLKAAVDGCKASEFHQGKNENGKVYDDLTLILRDGAKVEQFKDGKEQAPKGMFSRPMVRIE